MVNATQPLRGGHPVTPDDHGAWVQIVGALMMVWMLICFLMRIGIRLTINGPFKGDDLAIFIATVVGILQTIITFLEVEAGYGKRQSLLSASALISIQKTNYAGEILYILAMCLSRLSTSLLVARLTRSAGHLMATRIVSAISIIWGGTGIMVIAIRCKYAEPWLILKGQCPDMAARWIGVSSVGLVIEVLLLALPVYLVWNLQMPRTSKVIVVFAFAFRLPVLVAGIFRLSYLIPALPSDNYTFDSVYGIVCTQIELHYSLMSATIPCMKPFVKAFNTGYLGTAVRQTNYAYGYGSGNFRGDSDTKTRGQSFGLKSLQSRPEHAFSAAKAKTQGAKTQGAQKARSRSNLRLNPKELRPDAVDSSVYVEHNNTGQEESGSVTSHGSDQMIIRRTVGWDIRYEDDEQQGQQPQSLPVMGS